MKKIISFCVLLLTMVPIILLGCTSKDKTEVESNKLQVAVSISPIKEFVEYIGGDKVEVNSVVPDNVEAHDFELKTRDSENIQSKKLFIYNGVDMEHWVDDLKKIIDESDSNVKFIDSSIKSNIIDDNGKKDPHLWLSLEEAQNQCRVIADALIEVDSENKDYYESNYNNFKNQANELLANYKDKFKDVPNKNFITAHKAFGYLCRDFDLNQKSLKDIYGEGEPTAKTYEALANFCNENGIKIIFSESSESSKEAETLAKEINGNVEKLYSLEGKVEGKTYFEAMEENLDKILNALK
ncbi:MAG: zinc ABC transporter solute-binding protein [Clostridiales bacterium]|nr:zinc ABC transporter solute-binding protein [Clostridiales bacterium]